MDRREMMSAMFAIPLAAATPKPKEPKKPIPPAQMSQEEKIDILYKQWRDKCARVPAKYTICSD